MKTIAVASALLASSATALFAGGIDRSGQPIGLVFQDGNYIEFSYGSISPNVDGVFAGVVGSGDMAPSYTQTSFGIHTEAANGMGFTVIHDQPFGADVAYPAGTGYPLAGATAELRASAVTLIGSAPVSDRITVYGGLRQQSVDGTVTLPNPYFLDVSGSGYGYVIGAAYEIPDIALRGSVTYNSPITQTMTGTEGVGPTSFDTTTPQSVNIDFQTGVAPDTLAFASVRWVDWSEFEIAPPGYVLATGGPLVSYANDSVTYSAGIGRRFSDHFSGSFSVGYEAAQGGTVSNLGPTDGSFSVSVGGRFTTETGLNIQGGVRMVLLGDATTETIGAVFEGNRAVAVGLTVGKGF